MSQLSEERIRALSHYVELTSTATHLLFDCLEEIINLDAALNEAQPIHSGRLRVMWFTPSSSLQSFPGERTPMMVQWKKNFQTGKWRALRVPLSKLLRHQHQSKAFSSNKEKVRVILTALRTLLLMRKVIKKSLVQQPNISKHWVPMAQNKLKQVKTDCASC
jgi:hypothetical protein